MADRLTQLQDAVDDLATQFVATINYITHHHSYTPLSPTDEVREIKTEGTQDITPHPPQIFTANLRELSVDLITKEQQIEALIHSLPGINHSEQHQEQRIRELEAELVEVERRRVEAVEERERVVEKLDAVLRGVRRV